MANLNREEASIDESVAKLWHITKNQVKTIQDTVRQVGGETEEDGSGESDDVV